MECYMFEPRWESKFPKCVRKHITPPQTSFKQSKNISHERHLRAQLSILTSTSKTLKNEHLPGSRQPLHPPEMQHGLKLATYCQRAAGQDDVSQQTPLNS